MRKYNIFSSLSHLFRNKLILDWDLSYILLSAEIDVFYEFWINLDY